MLINLFHAFFLFACVVLVVRISLPTCYVLLNPYAATLDNLLTRLLRKLHPALPFPPKVLCSILILLFLCADAVMLSRLQLHNITIGTFAVFELPHATFLQWLFIACMGLLRHFLTLLAAVLFLGVWHRTKQLPGYSGDLLRLSVNPILRLPVTAQVLALCAGSVVFVLVLFQTATTVLYPLETLNIFQGAVAEKAAKLSISNLVFPFKWLVLSGLSILEIFAELHGFTVTLIFFALLSLLTRSKGLTYFLDDVFRLLRGPLPEIRIGMVCLTPLLTLFVFFLLCGFLPLIFVWVMSMIASLVGAYVV